jgi:porphobilinogen deaminase
VQSRIRKLNEDVVSCTLLAIAGLNRMDMQEHATQILDTDVMLPAVSQGAIGIACRSGDSKMMAGCHSAPVHAQQHKIRVHIVTRYSTHVYLTDVAHTGSDLGAHSAPV